MGQAFHRRVKTPMAGTGRRRLDQDMIDDAWQRLQRDPRQPREIYLLDTSHGLQLKLGKPRECVTAAVLVGAYTKVVALEQLREDVGIAFNELAVAA
ncbi:hypothetical protein [Tahibacter harae]|uniref:Uncharacterized protein n=1 Tax=Tahibacter harae TaxID=2963937 RepID=A0ABT1QS59_9GAMM|nr:hypothetical protein [Tahibacter harae]MCQ4165124.1 hypothetical protein [Tahibacter harae]